MKRLPVFASIAVGLAIALMIALGVWQLRRAEWKDTLLARYAANAHLPPVAYPLPPRPDETILYRPAYGECTTPLSWTTRAGHNRAGETGWRHVALCANGLTADLGWSRTIAAPMDYAGGPVAGTMDWDRDRVFVIVADTPAPGLEASARPSPRDIPNNHLAYAGQWFLFAGVAAAIYLIALRQRAKLAARPPEG